jgi:hypothetical protein
MLFYMDQSDDLGTFMDTILPDNVRNEEFENRIKRSNSDILYIFFFILFTKDLLMNMFWNILYLRIIAVRPIIQRL